MEPDVQPDQPTPKPPFSAHIFIFPFKWRSFHSGYNEHTPFYKRINLEDIRSAIDENGNWSAFSFKPQPEADNFNSYNEYAYFHDYARDVLGVNYKAGEHESSVVKAQYEYKIHGANPSYDIEIKTDAGSTVFSLKINSITLNFYESGVAALAFHLENNKSKDFNDILKINDYGRRIYPQFLGGLADEKDTDWEGKPNIPSLLNSPRGSFLPISIQLNNVVPKAPNSDESIPIIENFSHYATRNGVADMPFILPAHIGALLGKQFKTRFQEHLNGDIIIAPALDDRMFLLCYTFNNAILESLSRYDDKTAAYSWEKNDDWYRYIFVDGSSTPTIDSRNMKKTFLQQSTYDRWIESKKENGEASGHIFGVSRYSFMMLATDNFFTRNILIHHFSNQYFQMALLTLVQRATVLSYSAEAAWISDHLPRAMGLRMRTINNISDLYLCYTKFIHKIYFREVSPQEQGIELYDLLQNRLNIKQNVEDLDREMGELSQFVEAQQQRSISWISYVLLPISVVLSFFGLNYFGGANPLNVQPGRPIAWGSPELWSAFMIAIICLLAVLLVRFVQARPRRKNRFL